jgi:hypothetical protein
MWLLFHSVFVERIFLAGCREPSNDRKQFHPLAVEAANHIALIDFHLQF